MGEPARRDGRAIARYYEILDEAVVAAGGVRPVEQGEGDSVVGVFTLARDALRAALEAQRRLQSEVGWLPMRMAVHTGDAELRDEGNYAGQTIIRCARLRRCGHGGQVLVSESTAALVRDGLPDGAGLVDLGAARLRDLARPERVRQLTHPELRREFPPLRSLASTPHNVPVHEELHRPDAERRAVVDLLRAGRLVTLTGSGGCGKARLAQHSAVDMLDESPGGVWCVGARPITASRKAVIRTDRSMCALPTIAGSGRSSTW